MRREFEYSTGTDDDRLAKLENRTAELLRRLEQVALARDTAEYHASDHGPVEFPAVAPPRAGGGYADSGRSHPPDTGGYTDADARAGADPDAGPAAYTDTAAYAYADAVTGGYQGARGYAGPGTAGYADQGAGRYADPATGAYPQAGPGGPGGPSAPRDRTEALISRGRRHARRGRRRWRTIAVVAAAVAAGAGLIALVLPGGSASWPASVTTVRNEITIACQNPNVVSEPSQVNFACAKDTQQVLWVFSLLTSHNNPGYADSSNDRKGLEPIQPAQGGDIAWSLNLHHPYNPASPIDSLQVAARAINNIIGGATVTGSSGAPQVQAGLESSPANCARYTGSSALITRQGFPAVCALPVSTPDGEAALVSDVFQQWMVGAPSQYATEAGVLFENADNPGDPQVQSILSTLRSSGL
jgi:hypothetical protein